MEGTEEEREGAVKGEGTGGGGEKGEAGREWKRKKGAVNRKWRRRGERRRGKREEER